MSLDLVTLALAKKYTDEKAGGGDSGTNQILAAIDQAVFDKALLTSILNGTCENLSGDAITGIADYVFYMKGSLKTVILPNCIFIGDYAFYNCTELTEIELPMVTTIENNAFRSCIGLTEVNFPKVTTIETYAFYKCDGLIEVDFPMATTIGGSAFQEFVGLKKVNLPKATTIGAYAFYKCTGLTEVELPNVTRIENYTFQYCTGLKKIWIPECCSFDAKSNTSSPFFYCSPDLQIFCEVSEKPTDWGGYWNYYASGKTLNVTWGATYEDYLAYEV